MTKLSMFFKNFFSLLKAIAKYPHLDWRSIASEFNSSRADNGTYLTTPYHLNQVSVGYGTAIGRNSFISYTTIGKFCSLGPNLVCGWGIHPLNGISINPAFYSTKKQNGFTFSDTDKIDERKPIQIGNDVFIGANVTVLDGVSIGNGAVIGAGAVVSKNIPPYAVAVGCPIQILKYRFSPEIIKELEEIQWWDKDPSFLKKVEQQFFDVEGFISTVRTHTVNNHI